MDITFDIHNGKGDQVRVALAYYGTEIMQVFTDDPLILTLEFYDVIKIEEDTKPRFAHFITPEKYLPEVKLLEKLIREK